MKSTEYIKGNKLEQIPFCLCQIVEDEESQEIDVYYLDKRVCHDYDHVGHYFRTAIIMFRRIRNITTKRLKKYNCILNPVTENMENCFIFSTNGVIEPADRNDREATETIRVFNLQEDSLNSRQKQTMENTRKLLEQMDKEAVIGYLQGEEFPSAIAYEISRNQQIH